MAYYKFEVEYSEGKNTLKMEEWTFFNKSFRKIYRSPLQLPFQDPKVSIFNIIAFKLSKETQDPKLDKSQIFMKIIKSLQEEISS